MRIKTTENNYAGSQIVPWK